MSAVELRGITLAYDDTSPTGPARADPLVLVHGHPFDRSMWVPQVEQFGRSGRRVIAPDLRGYGQSSVVPGSASLETFARDIAALLDHLDVGQIVLGGLSMGGQIVLEFHRLFPERIRGLVLADTTPEAETAQGRQQRNAMADRLLAEGMNGYADEVLAMMVSPHNITTMPAVARHVRAMMTATAPEGAAAALRGRAERPDYVGMLGTIKAPTLVVVGREDEFTPVKVAQFMQERIPQSTLVVIDGAAHMPNLERTTEFNGALAHFLDSLN